MRSKFIVVPLVIFSIVFGFFYVLHNKAESPKPKLQNDSKSNDSSFNKTRYSTDQPGSIWWIVNKKRPLPDNYVPEKLTVPAVTLRLSSNSEQMQIRSDVAPEVEKLFEAASQENHSLMLASGFRSKQYQTQLYNGYVQTDGQAAADKFSAKPGTSEHQTGMAFDVCQANSNCDLVQSFGDTPTGKWVAEHAHEYGFVVRYLKGKEVVTGYEYEPWHLRYVGIDLATQLYKNKLTLEEYLLK